jgi:hypothetical protein
MTSRRTVPWPMKVAGGVRVRVDEAGGDDEAGGVDGALGLLASGGTDEDDAVAEDADVGVDGGCAGAVDERAVQDEEVELLGVGERRQQARDNNQDRIDQRTHRSISM